MKQIWIITCLLLINSAFAQKTCNPCCNRKLNGRLLILQSTEKDSTSESSSIQMCVPLDHTAIEDFKDTGIFKYFFDVDSSCRISNVKFFGNPLVDEDETEKFRKFFEKLNVDYFINDVRQLDCSRMRNKKKLVGKLIIGM